MTTLLSPVELKPIPVSEVGKALRHSGVYFLISRGIVVYVGQSGSVMRRLGEHISDLTKSFDSIATIPCDELNRLWLESQYIEKYKPLYNGMGDKSGRTPLEFDEVAKCLEVSVETLKDWKERNIGPRARRYARSRKRRYILQDVLRFAAENPELIAAAKAA